MPDSIFPSNKIDALAMLYLERQDLSNISPVELATRYTEVQAEINEYFKSTNTSQPNSIRKRRRVIETDIYNTDY